MDWKKWGKRLLFPPVWVTGALAVLCAAGLVTVFVKGWEQTIFAYGLYALSFYALSVLVIVCVSVLPRKYRQLRNAALSAPFAGRYLTDREFRGHCSLYLSLGINVFYILMNLWSWRRTGSWWFVVLSAYYGIMALMRFLLLRYMRKNTLGSSLRGEWRRVRGCAYLLLLVNLSLSGAVLMILYQNRGYDYPGILIYVMALYTFYSTVHAIVDLVKYHTLGSPVLSTAKIISLCAALVSMLNLETAMFAQFGRDMAPQHRQLFIILTGAGVSISVVSLSVYLIVKAAAELARTETAPQ